MSKLVRSQVSNLVVVGKVFGGSGLEVLFRPLAVGDGVSAEVLLDDFILLGPAAPVLSGWLCAVTSQVLLAGPLALHRHPLLESEVVSLG